MLPYYVTIYNTNKNNCPKDSYFLVFNSAKINYFIQSGMKYVFASVLIIIYDLLSYPCRFSQSENTLDTSLPNSSRCSEGIYGKERYL